MRYLIGMGNYTGFDDSIGLRVIEHVVREGLAQGLQAIDLSAGAINLIAYLVPETAAIVIVDSAKMGLAAGAFHFFRAGDVETRKTLAGISTHEDDVLQVVALAQVMHYPIPPLLFLGIEPLRVKNEIGLSPALAARIPDYARAAIERLQAM